MEEHGIFDRQIDRSGTRSTKWTRFEKQAQAAGGKQYPLWLADMDFAVCSTVSDAIKKRAAHPVYGYTDRVEEDFQLFARRFHRVYGYGTETEDIVLSTGVMYSLAAAIEVFTRPGDGVMVPTPAYPPFFDAVKNSGRRLVKVPMGCHGGRWELDLQRMEEAADKTVKAVILCNPHNPTGTVFTGEELLAFAKLCERKGLYIFSDEIHCDFVYGAESFTPVMNVCGYAKERTVAMVAPTKSFNLAGLKVSAAVIKNRKMNEKFRARASHTGIASINLFALEALRAAYGKPESEEWLRELIGYLDGNRELVREFLEDRLPYVRTAKPEGTYFYWLDFRDSPFGAGEIHRTLAKKGNVFLNEGKTFGEEYEGFERLNMACPRAFLTEALERMAEILR